MRPSWLKRQLGADLAPTVHHALRPVRELPDDVEAPAADAVRVGRERTRDGVAADAVANADRQTPTRGRGVGDADLVPRAAAVADRVRHQLARHEQRVRAGLAVDAGVVEDAGEQLAGPRDRARIGRERELSRGCGANGVAHHWTERGPG